LVDPPRAVGGFLRDACGAAVEQIERGLDCFADRALGRRADLVAALEPRFDGLGKRLGWRGDVGCRHELSPLLARFVGAPVGDVKH